MLALLPTKLAIPPLRAGVVARPRLLHRLAEVDRAPLTVVTAPAGFGKTTLLAAWAASWPRPVAWLALDEGDDDPARFWRYVAAALDTVQEGAGSGILDLLQMPAPASQALLAALVTACTLLAPGTALVLDDYHLITDCSIHETLGALAGRLPAEAHLVLATRADPPLPLARLRARGHLLEVRAADLRFTAGEAAAFLRTVMDLDLSPHDVAALEGRTEGWAAGLQLAALAVREHAAPSAFVATFAGSHRFVLDYLAEEVLQAQPEPARRFLLRTGILERLCAELCDAVTGERDGQEMLEHAERANLFLVPLDDERRWYRYHHLFAEVLRGLLRRQEPDLVHVLHARAAGWYAAHGLPDEAIHHALAAGDAEAAADLIERVGWATYWHHGELATLRGWLDALPEDVVRARPRLCLLHAWALVLSNPRAQAEIAAWLRAAEIALPTTAPERRALLGRVQAVRGMIAALYADVEPALEFCRAARELLSADDIAARAMAAYAQALALWLDGQAFPAHDSFAEASTLYRAAGNLHTDLIALNGSAIALALAGRLRDADAVYREAIARGTGRAGRMLPATCYPYAFRADLLREWDLLDEALGHVQEGLAVAERTANLDALWNGFLVLAAVQQARGDLDAAVAALGRAEEIAAPWGLPHVTAATAARRARLLLAQGDLAGAARWVRAQEETHNTEALVTYGREALELAQVRIALATRQADEALAILERLLAAAEAAGRGARVVEILALRALAERTRGDEDVARATLRRALARGEPEGFIHTFADEGAPMAALLRGLLATARHDRGGTADPSTAYIARVLAACALPRATRPAARRPSSSARETPVEPAGALTAREREVLELIASGLTNAQIAARLVVELSTVKRHVNNIYTKLGVETRTAAVARARALHLLDGA